MNKLRDYGLRETADGTLQAGDTHKALYLAAAKDRFTVLEV